MLTYRGSTSEESRVHRGRSVLSDDARWLNSIAAYLFQLYLLLNTREENQNRSAGENSRKTNKGARTTNQKTKRGETRHPLNDNYTIGWLAFDAEWCILRGTLPWHMMQNFKLEKFDPIFYRTTLVRIRPTAVAVFTNHGESETNITPHYDLLSNNNWSR